MSLFILHACVQMNVCLALADSEKFVVMSRNLPAPERLETYLAQWSLDDDEDVAIDTAPPIVVRVHIDCGHHWQCFRPRVVIS